MLEALLFDAASAIARLFPVDSVSNLCRICVESVLILYVLILYVLIIDYVLIMCRLRDDSVMTL